MEPTTAPAPPRIAFRRHDLDWLRVMAFALLILFHTGMFFNHWGWHVKNNVLSRGIEYPMLFLSQWRMALLFMISGAGVYWALGRRSAGILLVYANHAYEPEGTWALPFALLQITNAWCWLLTIFGHGYRHLQFSNSFLAYANPAVYPFYILHQTITVTVGYFLISYDWPWGLKFLLLAGATFGGCFLMYHFLIRPFGVMRVLFGGKA